MPIVKSKTEEMRRVATNLCKQWVKEAYDLCPDLLERQRSGRGVTTPEYLLAVELLSCKDQLMTALNLPQIEIKISMMKD